MPKRIARPRNMKSAAVVGRDAQVGLEAQPLPSSPEVLASIDAAEAQITAGTMTPLDEALDELWPEAR